MQYFIYLKVRQTIKRHRINKTFSKQKKKKNKKIKLFVVHLAYANYDIVISNMTRDIVVPYNRTIIGY